MTFDEGGRLHPIDWSMDVERGYWGMARFEEAADEWSVKVFFSPGASCFFISFRAEEAPHHLLVKGTKFDLKEGRKVVARGVIR